MLPAAAVPPVRAFLTGACAPEEPHAESCVESIYFDADEFVGYRDKRDSQLHKAKLRLRWYDGGGPVFAEIKHRRGERRDKFRAVLDLDGAELARLGLESPRLAGVPLRLAALGVPVPGGMRPVLRVRFHRRRWLEGCHGARVALDTAIAAVERTLRTGLAGAAGPLPFAVVEVKGETVALPTALRPLLALGCRPAAVSKYAACLAAPTTGAIRP